MKTDINLINGSSFTHNIFENPLIVDGLYCVDDRDGILYKYPISSILFITQYIDEE